MQFKIVVAQSSTPANWKKDLRRKLSRPLHTDIADDVAAMRREEYFGGKQFVSPGELTLWYDDHKTEAMETQE